MRPWENTTRGQGSLESAGWELDKTRQARRNLEKVRLKLISPSLRAFSGTASELGLAVECLRKLEFGLHSGPQLPVARRRLLSLEMASLRRELREVATLLAAVGKFYQGWARLVSPPVDDAPANYTVRGTQGAPGSALSGKVVAIG